MTYTGDTAQARLDVDLRIVGQEGTVEGAVWTVDGNLLDVGCLAFAHGKSALHHITRQTALYGGGTVLYVDHRHIGIGALTEEDTDGAGTVVGGVGGHVHHTLDTVDGFFEGYDDTFLHRLGIGAGIAGHDADGGRGYLRELLEGELAQSDDADKHHQY